MSKASGLSIGDLTKVLATKIAQEAKGKGKGKGKGKAAAAAAAAPPPGPGGDDAAADAHAEVDAEADAEMAEVAAEDGEPNAGGDVAPAGRG